MRRDPSGRMSMRLPGGENKSKGAVGSVGGPGQEVGWSRAVRASATAL